MDVLATVTGAFASKVGAFLPDLLAALAILVVGWIGCNIAKRLMVRLLRLVQFDRLAERSGISRALELGGIRQSFAEIVGLLIFWFLFLMVLVATLDVLGLPGVTQTVDRVLGYIPKVVASMVILILGLYGASFLETIVRTTCANAGLRQAEALGRVAYFTTTVFVVVAILEILDLIGQIVIYAFGIAFGAVSLALAIAFGLGGRDVAGKLLAKWFEDRPS